MKKVLDRLFEKVCLLEGGYSRLVNKGSAFRFKNFFRNKGAIIVEFAMSVPILIIVIFYVHDLALYAQLKSKTEFVAYSVVSMLQNVSQNRSSRRITLDDIRRIRCAASLIVYPAMLGFATSGRGSSAYRSVGHFLSLYIYCVVGTGNNKGKCVWRWDSGYQNTTVANSDSGTTTGNNLYAVVRYQGSETDTNNIYKGLTIKNGEMKIIVEISLRTGLCKYTNGQSVSSVPISKRFGFYLITPKCPTPKGNGSHFHSVVIFSPNPDLFTTSPPTN